MNVSLLKSAWMAIATFAVSVGLVVLAPVAGSAQASGVASNAISASAHQPMSNRPVEALGGWRVYDFYQTESECRSAKRFIDTVTNLPTLPPGDSCYHNELGYYFLFWDD